MLQGKLREMTFRRCLEMSIYCYPHSPGLQMSPGWIQQFSQPNKGLLTSAVSPALGLGEKYIEMERTVVCSSREDCNP